MKTAKLFMNGQSQAVRLPKEFRFEGDQVYIQRVGSAVVLLPYAAPWDALFESLDQFSQDFAQGDLAQNDFAQADLAQDGSANEQPVPSVAVARTVDPGADASRTAHE